MVCHLRQRISSWRSTTPDPSSSKVLKASCRGASCCELIVGIRRWCNGLSYQTASGPERRTVQQHLLDAGVTCPNQGSADIAVTLDRREYFVRFVVSIQRLELRRSISTSLPVWLLSELPCLDFDCTTTLATARQRDGGSARHHTAGTCREAVAKQDQVCIGIRQNVVSAVCRQSEIQPTILATGCADYCHFEARVQHAVGT